MQSRHFPATSPIRTDTATALPVEGTRDLARAEVTLATRDVTASSAPPVARCGPEAGDELRLLTLDEVAAILRVPVSWLRHRVANHSVACTRLGRHIRFTREQVATIVDGAVQPLIEEPVTGLTRRARRPR
ncbi:MAG: helix-turn-helix domain-containing protein [Actinomycetota bacterium]|nr:helix-turn-helix domain-containing protein [Actinomycetota bacterium]